MNELWILGWWNLIFIVPFGLALLYMGLYTASGISFGEADADADLDADASADSNTEASADADADADHDADHDAAGHVHGHSHVPLHHAMLNFIGIGRVPLSIWLTVLMLAWGLIGFATNQVLRPTLASGLELAATSIPLAAIGSLLAARFIAAVLHRWLPLNETYAMRKHEYLGTTGEAIFAIDGTFGMVAIRDHRGNLFQVAGRVQPGDSPIDKGACVQLVAYNASENVYYVVRCDGAAPNPSRKEHLEKRVP